MTTATEVQTKLTVDRKVLVKALEKLNRILAHRTSKPVLHHIRMDAAEGKLWLAGTDLDISLALHIPAEGQLPRCLAPCRELLQRVKSSSAPNCQLWREDDALVVNGGAVHHRLATLPPEEYPLIPLRPEGNMLTLQAGAFRDDLKTALVGVARENTRYAINGILLEIKRGNHLVATDGRRMVVLEQDPIDTQVKELAVILPARFCQQILRLAEKETGALRLFVKDNFNDKGEKTPSDLYLIGSGWVLHTMEVDGHFPCWRDVIPKNESKFLADRAGFLHTLREVSTACSEYNKGVHLRLGADGITVSARSYEGAESSGQVEGRFQGGGDSLILTGFNPDFLIDVLETLSGPTVLIEVQQNRLGTDGKVYPYPAVFYNWADRRTKWVVMPVNIQVEPGPDSLGSNYQPEEAVVAA